MNIDTVAIIGAGTMGHALALVHALGGMLVRLQDIDSERLNGTPALIEGALETLVEAGSLEASEANAVLPRVELVPELADAIADVDLIVEAVVEDKAVKREVFSAIDAGARANTIIASNTSHLDVFPLVPASRQANTLIAHWYTPPYIVDLVDLAPGPETTKELLQVLHTLYTRLGKKPVIFDQLIPGYIANRLQAALNLEIYRMLDEGWASAEQVDDSIRHGLALRLAILGHVKKADYTGLDMIQRSLSNGMFTPAQPTGSSKTLDNLIDAGRTGVMAGAGFYDYAGKSPVQLFRERDKALIELKQALDGIEPL